MGEIASAYRKKWGISSNGAPVAMSNGDMWRARWKQQAEQKMQEEEERYNREQDELRRKQMEEAAKPWYKKIDWKKLAIGDPAQRKEFESTGAAKGVSVIDRAGRGDYGFGGALLSAPISGIAGFLSTGDQALRHLLVNTVNQKQIEKSGNQQREQIKGYRDKGIYTQEQYAKKLGEILQWEKDERNRVHKKMGIKEEDLNNGRLSTKRVVADAGMAFVDLATLGVGSTAFKGTKYGAQAGMKSFKYTAPAALKALKAADASADVVKVLSKQGAKNIFKTGAKASALNVLNTGLYGMSENRSLEDTVKDMPLSAAIGFGLGSGAETLGTVLRNKGITKSLAKQDYNKEMTSLLEQERALQKTIDASRKVLDNASPATTTAAKRVKEIADLLKQKKNGEVKLTPSQELKLRDESRGLIGTIRQASKEKSNVQKTLTAAEQGLSEIASKKSMLGEVKASNSPVLNAVRAARKNNPDNKVLVKLEETLSKPRIWRETMTNIEKASPETAMLLRKQAFTEGVLKGEGEQILSQINNMAGKGRKAQTALWKEIRETLTSKTRKEIADLAKKGNKQAKQALIVGKMLDSRAAKMRAAGLDVGDIEKYFPQLVNPANRQKLQNVLAEAGLGKQESQIVKEMFSRGFRPEKSDIEYSRIFDKLPKEVQEKIKNYYIDDPAMVFANWNKETAGSLAQAQFSGPGLAKLEASYKEASEDGIKYIKDSYDLWRFGREKTTAEQTIKGLEVFTKMGMSTLSNITQHTNTAAVGGPMRALKAAWYLKNPKNQAKIEKLALDSGVNIHEITDELTQAIYEMQKKNPMVSASELLLKVNQFKTVEKGNRLVATLTGKMYLEDMVKDVKKNWSKLEEMGINPAAIKNGKLSKEQLGRGIYEFVGKTQFYTDAMNLPRWTVKNGAGEVISTLGKFSMKQTKFLKDQIVKQAMRGNLFPLMNYIWVGSIFGEMTVDVRNAITGKEREYTIEDMKKAGQEGDWAQVGQILMQRNFKENLPRAGGYGYLYDMFQGMEYNDTLWGKALGMMGPVGGDVNDIIKVGEKFATGGPDAGWQELTKQTTKRLPFVDPALTKIADPAAGTIFSDRKSEDLIPNADNPFTKGLNQTAATYPPEVFYASNERDRILKTLPRDAQKNYETLKVTYEGETPLMASARKASVYIDFPELWYLDKKYRIENTKNTGQPHDPIYDLTWDKARKVYYQVARGDKFNESELYKTDWYSTFKEDRTKYYEQIANDRGNQDYAGSEASKYYVEKPAGVQAKNELGIYDEQTKAYQDATREMYNKKLEDMGAVAPDLYNLTKSNISAGMENLKSGDQKTLWYMQALRQAGIPGAFDSFFDKNPELDPKSSQFSGKFAKTGSSSYTRKAKQKKTPKPTLNLKKYSKKVSKKKVKAYALKKSKVKLTSKLETKYK